MSIGRSSELTTFIDQNKATLESTERNNAVKAEVVRDQEVKLRDAEQAGRHGRAVQQADGRKAICRSRGHCPAGPRHRSERSRSS